MDITNLNRNPKFIITVIKNISKIIDRELTQDDIISVRSDIARMDFSMYKRFTIPNIINVLSTVLSKKIIKERKKRSHYIENDTYKYDMHEYDMHEYLANEIKTNAAPTSTINTTSITNTTSTINISPIESSKIIDVVSLLGMKSLTDVQNIFNPTARYIRNYLVFDSRYRTTDSTSASLCATNFQFNYVDTANLDSTQGNINTVGTIRNLISLKMHQAVFPYFPVINSLDNLGYSYLNPYSNRISILINELGAQAFVASGSRNYHWIFRLQNMVSFTPNNNSFAAYNQYYQLQTENYNDGVIFLRKPVVELSSLTFSFGNPLSILAFPPDRVNVTFNYTNPMTIITSIPLPLITVGSFIYITQFITADPSTDAYTISLVNSPFGQQITSISGGSTIFTININGTTVTPLSGLSVECYFAQYRFIFAIETISLRD